MIGVLAVILGLCLVFWLMGQLSKKSFFSNVRRKSKLLRTKEFLLNADYEKALSKSKEAITLFKLKLERFNPENGELVALSGMDFRSFGEIITISLKKADSGTSVKIESTPSIPFTLLDYGRNQANVDAIYQLIAK